MVLKIAVIGASNIRNLVYVLQEFTSQDWEIHNLTKPGWVPTDSAINKLRSKLNTVGLTENDVIICELFSNSIFRTGDNLPTRSADNIFHYPDVRLLTFSESCELARKFDPIFNGWPQQTNFIVLPPAPRFLSTQCCDQHMENIEELRKTLFGSSLSGPTYLAGILRKTYMNTRLIPYKSLTGLNARDAGNIHVFRNWMKTDDVHLTKEGLRVLSNQIMATLLALTTDKRNYERRHRFPKGKHYRACDETESQYANLGPATSPALKKRKVPEEEPTNGKKPRDRLKREH